MPRRVEVGVVNDAADAGDEPAPMAGAGSRPALQGSPLFDLRSILEAKREALHIDLPVPRWGGTGANGQTLPEIVVRYGPVDPTVAAESAERRQKAKSRDWAMLTNADVLVRSCIGVYAVLDGERYSLRQGDPEGTWTRFDKDLAAALGLDPDHAKAVDVARTLYLTDGDLMAAANQLAAWSAVALPQAEEDALGE